MNRHYLTINGNKISYLHKYSSGKTVFCLPPWPSGALAYKRFMEMTAGLNIIAIDLPDLGGDSTNEGSWKIEDYVQLILDFINHLDLKVDLLIGYSFGGLLMQKVIESGDVKPNKVVYLSTFNEISKLYNDREKLFRIYKMVKPAVKDLNRIKYIIKSIYLKVWTRDQTNKENLKTPFVQETIADDMKSDANDFLNIWVDNKDLNVLNANMQNFSSLIIHSDKDLDFIIEGSNSISDYLDVPITPVPGNHGHFVFNPEISVKLIDDFIHDSKMTT